MEMWIWGAIAGVLVASAAVVVFLHGIGAIDVFNWHRGQ